MAVLLEVPAAVEEAHLGEAPAEEAVEVRNGIGLVWILLLAGEITHTWLNIYIGKICRYRYSLLLFLFQ